jgi:hypothetical protein
LAIGKASLYWFAVEKSTLNPPRGNFRERFPAGFLRSYYESVGIAAMTAVEWQQIKNILADALECDSEAEQLALVVASCRDDAKLKAELDALLAQADRMWLDESFLLQIREALLQAFTSH